MKNFSAMLASVLLMAGVTPSWAQEQPGGLLPVRDLADRIKKPADWFLWGADLRLRNDSAENPNLTEADPPGHTYSFERLRIREWNSFTPCKEFEFNLRFTWEGRHYWAPASKKQWDGSDIVFDNLNGKFTFQEIPATLIVGRQDMVFGDGWLISDGTPLDGPRTNYFDAVRATVELPPIKGALDLIYIDQTASPDSRLSPIFSKSKPLMEQNERGVIVYFSNSSIERTSINAYFIYKHDEAVLANGDSGEVYTIGSRLAHDVNNDLSGRIEGAYQFGTRRNAVMFPNQDGSLSAWGVVSRLTYSFHDPSKSQAWLGYQGLSGNDAHDTHNRQFDPLWGRWAQYSELFPNDLDRPSDRSNLHRINLGYQVEPATGMSLQANYNALFAYANRFAGTPGFSDHGSFKGHLLAALLQYRFNRFWSGYLLGEYFVPGNYYENSGDPLDARNDPAAFLRAQLVFTF